ncbi:right-handed parallel beta-helix repeat-containing protein [Enhygromyxa salina]|uniref:Right handed beta helix domain-containing protein n=1 Tax=Enhygromyxa salina TaxID=215803 RepID=A0A2S9YTB8_9BACT|nr:right-handed parallel beta-helix repeat-containing protein [Enhygromyxa salina]PRQ08357.1 hypothetical protein ENSA7_19840 [Enhygromyxa salina]
MRSVRGLGGQPDPCLCEEGDDPQDPPTPYEPKTYLPGGPIEDLRIYDNRIRNMGQSGISTSYFWSSNKSYEDENNVPRFIVVTDADIARNIIEDNCKTDTSPSGYRYFDKARGGVILAASVNAWIHENTIRNNGKVPRGPICGVGLVAAMNAVIEDNQIVDNCVELPEGSDPVTRGLRGGIVVWEATRLRTRAKTGEVGEEMPAFPTSTPGEIPPEPVKDWTGASSQAAVTVRGNEVSHLLGKALWIRRGFGAIIVTGNSLVSYGAPVIDDELENVAFRWAPVGLASVQVKAGSAAVEVVNLAHALDADTADVPKVAWTDDTAATVECGALVFSNNNVEGRWPWRGGVGCGVLLSALDSCVVTDNVSRMVTGNPFGGVPSELLMQDVLSPIDSLMKQVLELHTAMAWLMVHLYVGAASSVQVTGNRIVEGSVDMLFSVWLGSETSITR